VRPFPRPSLYRAVRATLRPLLRADRGHGIQPVERWPGSDPWSAPTAWSAWSLAALGERRTALRLLGDLRRDATAAGDLPERVDVHSGVAVSTTPLAWPHAFAILALHELWPGR
jgi:GH15 family glucan-1,4-alpha-glucosidase